MQEVDAWTQGHPSHEDLLSSLERVWKATAHLAPDDEGAVPIERLRLLAEARRSWDERAPSARPEPDTRAAGRTVRRSLGAVAAIALVLGGGLFGAWLVSRSDRPSFGPAEIRTVRGEMATVELLDGTVIRLAPESMLRFSPGSADRSVWLEGRAFFSVHHDPDHPFRVRTRAGEALALGTRFDIQVRAEALQVSVLEGVVAVDTGPGPVRVEAGHAGRLAEGRSVEVTEVPDILARLDWLGQFMAFERTPLSQVAEEVERLYRRPVEIRGDELASRTVTGVYEGRTFEQALEVICLVVGAHCQIGESGAVIQP